MRRPRGIAPPRPELPPPPLLPPWPGPVTGLGLSTRATNALMRTGVTTVTQLSALTDDDLMDIRNFGWGCLIEVRGKVGAPGTTPPADAAHQATVLMALALAALAELASRYPVKERKVSEPEWPPPWFGAIHRPEPGIQDIRALLGKHVRVRYNDQDIVTGLLVGFGEGGDFEIADDTDGMLHYAWPLLRIEEVS